MSETLELHVLSEEEMLSRRESGLIVPFSQGNGLEVIDCADSKSLTPESLQRRIEDYGHDSIPGRYFGGASGLATTALIALSAQEGESTIREFVEQYSADAFNDFAADLSVRAMDMGIVIHRHSASDNEGSPSEIAPEGHTHEHTPAGCALEANLRTVIDETASPFSVEESMQLLGLAGVSAPVIEASEGAVNLSKYMPQGFELDRSALRKARNKHNTIPFTILDSSTAPQNGQQKAVVIDFAGYRSSAGAHNAAELPRYHHTPRIVEIVGNILPEFNLDPELLYASSVLLGAATRRKLSGDQTPNAIPTEIIPAEYNLALAA